MYFETCLKLVQDPYAENLEDVLIGICGINLDYDRNTKDFEVVRFLLLIGSLNDAFMTGMEICWIIFTVQLLLAVIVYAAQALS